jgi:hypothetical protein
VNLYVFTKFDIRRNRHKFHSFPPSRIAHSGHYSITYRKAEGPKR